MPKVRRSSDVKNRELRSFIVYDKKRGEYFGRRYPVWTSRMSDARPFKRQSDALNSLGHRTHKDLEDRELVLITVYPDYNRMEETVLVVEESWSERFARRRREQTLNQI